MDNPVTAGELTHQLSRHARHPPAQVPPHRPHRLPSVRRLPPNQLRSVSPRLVAYGNLR